MSNDTIRVLLAADHHIVRFGLAAFIQQIDTLELVGQAQNGLQAIDLCQKYHPDVVIMDIVMPEMDGVTASQYIARECPHTKILALSTFKEIGQINQMIQAGASGYLVKGCSMKQLESAIVITHLGGMTFDRDVGNILMENLKEPTSANSEIPSNQADLTTRELDVLKEMATGKNNREIAQALFISCSTVKNHVSSVLYKLEASTRTEAVSLALQQRVI